MSTKSDAPSSSKEFDKVYSSAFLHWLWGDTRIPKELQEIVAGTHPETSLELGCGLGRFSSYMAKQGIKATGIDFSGVAIEKARKRIEKSPQKPSLLVGDVTNLEMLKDPFDVAFDIGCFHCLNEVDQQKYVKEVHRLLKPGSTLLIWTLNHAPIGIRLNSDYMAKVFDQSFHLKKAVFSRRRIIGSHWYWFVRKD